jgi:GWxTD domain-containing protein
MDEEHKRIMFNVDYAGFKSEDGQVALEVYYSFARHQLKFIMEDSLKVARFNIDITIFSGDSLIRCRNWSGRSVLADSTQDKIDSFLSVSKFTLPAGEYHGTITIEDLNANLRGSKELPLKLNAFSEDALSISDIEFASSITKDSSMSIFTKNNYQVVPNPSAVFGTSNPMLYFYVEIYDRQDDLHSIYSVEYSILNDDESEFRTYAAREIEKPDFLMPEIGGFNVVSFPTGLYTLQLKVTDLADGAEFVKRKKFYVYRKRPTIAAKVSRGSEQIYQELKNKTLQEIDEEFKSASYLASKEDNRMFKSLNLEGKRKFLAEFWPKLSDGSVPPLDLRANHLMRVKFANEHFSVRSQDPSGAGNGWKTDRGRVVIQYGEPDKVEKNLNLSGKRGYEIWRYYAQEGGLIFVFVDKGGFGDLELVHSNARREISDPDWQRWIVNQ